MYKIEPLLPEDLFSLDLVNLDYKTDNYSFNYYLSYFLNHSEQMFAIKTENLKSEYFVFTNKIIGYIIGKIENQNDSIFYKKESNLSMHISALSISPSYRKYKLGYKLCKILEYQLPNILFIDLFVRKSNLVAINFYIKNGYKKFRTIFEYYRNPTEDAFDMRKFILEKESKGKDIDGSMLP